MLTADFIDGTAGQLFCAIRLPESEWEAPGVLVVPAFGDEMNKARRMVTETAIQLNRAGIAVLIPDLYGTGDSEGSFADASWRNWVSDLEATANWAIAKGIKVRGMIAVRSGALLAAQLVQSCSIRPLATVFWQPVSSGSVFTKQMLRVRAMSSAVNAGQRETVDDLLCRILDSETVYAAGYPLTKHVVEPLVALELVSLVSKALGDLHTVEVVRDPERCGDFTQSVGAVTAQAYRTLGEPYWTASETVVSMDVVNRTASLLRERII